MAKLIFAYLFHGFRKTWKLYLTNILSLVVIILLFAYLDGSKRQLNLQNSVFSGEVVVQMKDVPSSEAIPNVDVILREQVKGIQSVSKKIRSSVTYKLPGKNNTGDAELLGVDLKADKNLADYLTLVSGRLMENEEDVLLPSSILENTDVKVGDSISIQGKTAENVFNSSVYKVCGIYQFPDLNLYNRPKLIIQYKTMENFYYPRVSSIEYCLFFKDSKVPETINSNISTALSDSAKTKVKSINAKQVTMMDVLNISVQFNVFLVIMVLLTILVMTSVIILVNFNIYTIIFRKRSREIGTLMAFGTPVWKIALTLFIESVLQVVLCTLIAVIACELLSLIARQQLAGGFIEVLLLLLSGTNRLDLYIQFYQVKNCFFIILTAVTISQIPILLRVLFSNPILFINKKS